MSEVTDRERAAWQRLHEMAAAYTPEMEELLMRIATLLPDTLTNSQPELPTEPGRYVDHAGNSGWFLGNDQWFHDGKRVVPNQALPFAPFTRLAPERPQVTRNQIISAILDAGSATDSQADAVLALVKGTQS